MAYRLLALNIDGTILHSNSRLTKQTREAIEFVKQKGVHITLITERPFITAQKVAKSLKLDSMIISHSGAFVAQNVEDPLFVRRIEEDAAIELVEVLERHVCHIRVHHERYALSNRVKQKRDLIGKMTINVGDPLFYPITFIDSLTNELLKKPISPLKIQVQFFNEAEKTAALNELQLERLGVQMNEAKPGLLEFTCEGVSKERGLQIVAHELGISSQAIVAIGASMSDMEMIRHAGLGVAMGNSPEALKDEADWVTRSNDQHGVAYMVKEVFRKQLRVEIK